MIFKKFLLKTFTGLFALLWVTAYAGDASLPIKVKNLAIKEYWIRPAAGPNTAAYLTIVPNGQGDNLIKVECPDASHVELHTHIEENGIMKMRPVPSVKIEGEAVNFKPGGLHIMLMGLKESFKGRESIPLTLHFEKAGVVTIDFPVKKPE